MTTLRISITKEVLEATKDCRKESCYATKHCAIAHAVRGIWPKAIVGLFHILPFGGLKNEIFFPHGKYEFINRFDRATPAERAAMQPFSFDIEVSDEVIGEVNIEEIRRICEGSKTLELI